MNEDAEKLKGFLFKIIDEHNFVVRYFDEDNPRHKKDYWLIPTEEMFLEDCRGKKSKGRKK